MLQNEPVMQDIIDASERIKNHIHRTPILTSSAFNSIFSCELFFKCENMQKVGALNSEERAMPFYLLTKVTCKKEWQLIRPVIMPRFSSCCKTSKYTFIYSNAKNCPTN